MLFLKIPRWIGRCDKPLKKYTSSHKERSKKKKNVATWWWTTFFAVRVTILLSPWKSALLYVDSFKDWQYFNVCCRRLLLWRPVPLFFVVVCCYLKSRPIIIRDPDIIEYSRKYKLRVNNESHGGILRQSSCPWEMNSPVKNETQRIRSKMFENNFRHTLFSPFLLISFVLRKIAHAEFNSLVYAQRHRV